MYKPTKILPYSHESLLAFRSHKFYSKKSSRVFCSSGSKLRALVSFSALLPLPFPLRFTSTQTRFASRLPSSMLFNFQGASSCLTVGMFTPVSLGDDGLSVMRQLLYIIKSPSQCQEDLEKYLLGSFAPSAAAKSRESLPNVLPNRRCLRWPPGKGRRAPPHVRTTPRRTRLPQCGFAACLHII